MTIDMSKYLGLYVTESAEHLEALAKDLVQGEKERSPEAIDSMFRHAHSVKGMAASMGFEVTATLAHRVEDLVDLVRSDLSRLNREMVDLLLAATDALLTQVKAAGDGRPFEETSVLQAQLSEKVAGFTGKAPERTRVAQAVVNPGGAAGVSASAALVSGAPGEGAAPNTASDSAPGANAASPGTSSSPAIAAPGSAEPKGQPELATVDRRGTVAVPVVVAPVETRPDAALGLPPRFSVKVRIAPTCAVPGVRGFLVHKRLVTLGNIFDLKPALDDLKAGRIPEGLISLELETSSGEAGIGAALKNVSEVELVSIKPIVITTAPLTPKPGPPAPEVSKVVGQDAARTVRVRTELLDYFLDTVGELLLATARIREVGKVLPTQGRAQLEEPVDRLHGLVKDLHDKVMKARMTPLAVITDRLPRAARDIARRRDREVDLVISGAETELDRAIIDDLADPLLHILRNCIDHGIEPAEERLAAQKPAKGRVLVTVRRARDRVVIELEDDGRGMDANNLRESAVARGLLTAEMAARMTEREAFLLACLPGVSTAKDISEISGRGVGMDAVKRAVENVGGTLEIESERGRGTRFTLKLPLTVAVVNLLLVAVGEEIFGLPIAKVLGAIEVAPDALSASRDAPMLSYAGSLVPVHVLAELLEVEAPARIGIRPYVVMESDAGKVALAVDALLTQQEVVLKALSRPLDLLVGLSGVTILGTGRPVFILDVPRLLSA